MIDTTEIVKRAGKRRRFRVLASGSVLFAAVVLNSQVARSQPQYVGPSILPPAPDAIFGGNPFQGLGRSDDPGPSREKQFGYPTYNDSAFNANHMQDQPAPTFYSNSYAMYPHPEEATTGIGTGAGIAPFPVSGPGGGTFANEIGTTTGSGSPSGSGITASDRLSQGYGASVAPGTSPQPGGGGLGGSGGPGGTAGSGGAAGVGGFGPGSGGANPNGLPEGYVPTSSLDTPTKQTSTPQENGWPSGNPAGTSTFSNNSTFAPGFGGQAGYGTPLTPDEITQKQAGNPNTAARQAFIDANTPQTRSAEAKGNRLLTDLVARRGQSGNNSVGGNEDKKSPYAIPPQPETPLSYSGISGKSDIPGKHPLGEAINDIKGGRLQDAMNHLNEILQNDQDNANAHYLKAVVSVLTRNFDQAKEEYQETLRLSHNGELTRRAQLGLSKLTH
ncbi:MAG TPA: tetratricopeptide repeat protein [Oculatellaceae cyanobacterium]